MRRLLFRAFHAFRRGDDLLHTWSEAEAFQWADPRLQREHQVGRTVDLIRELRRQVPFYRDLLSDVRDAELREAIEGGAWDRVPVVGKPELASQPAAFRTQDPVVVALPNATSGSTGESFRFFLDSASRDARAATTHRFHRWAGVEPWDRHAKLWGARFDAPPGGVRQALTGYLHPQLFLSSYDMSDETLPVYARRLEEFSPRAITSYPSPMEYFASQWPRLGRRLPELRAVLSSAEQLHDHQRALIEETFGCPVFDRYGSREFGNIAQECEAHAGLHVAADRLLVEIVDPGGRVVGEGERGEVVVTDFDNRAMPFLRYRTGDVARWETGTCTCGRTLPRLARLEGRVMDLVRAPGGVVISGTFWPQIVKQASPDVRLFQVVQEFEGRVQIRLVTHSGGTLDERAERALRDRIADRSEDLEVEIAYVADIPLTPGGKRRTVINRLGGAQESS